MSREFIGLGCQYPNGIFTNGGNIFECETRNLDNAIDFFSKTTMESLGGYDRNLPGLQELNEKLRLWQENLGRVMFTNIELSQRFRLSLNIIQNRELETLAKKVGILLDYLSRNRNVDLGFGLNYLTELFEILGRNGFDVNIIKNRIIPNIMSLYQNKFSYLERGDLKGINILFSATKEGENELYNILAFHKFILNFIKYYSDDGSLSGFIRGFEESLSLYLYQESKTLLSKIEQLTNEINTTTGQSRIGYGAREMGRALNPFTDKVYTRFPREVELLNREIDIAIGKLQNIPFVNPSAFIFDSGELKRKMNEALHRFMQPN